MTVLAAVGPYPAGVVATAIVLSLVPDLSDEEVKWLAAVWIVWCPLVPVAVPLSVFVRVAGLVVTITRRRGQP